MLALSFLLLISCGYIVNCSIDNHNLSTDCRENEIFTCGCVDSTCRDQVVINCVMCHDGCFCKEGYLRNDEGKCVKC